MRQPKQFLHYRNIEIVKKIRKQLEQPFENNGKRQPSTNSIPLPTEKRMNIRVLQPFWVS
jgi:hypothetical protein